MVEIPSTAATVSLAAQAAELSADLYSVQESCGHESTSADILAIADELALLSTTMGRLHEAVSQAADQYTVSFKEDLEEITTELKMVFEEISECVAELQKSDRTSNSAVAWMFKRGRVHRLQKHLEALKTTLIVMRTVLWHGKEYGTQNSPGRLAESSPHTMHEDRVILESIFAQNRNAIVDLHNLDEIGHHHHFSTSSDSPGTSHSQRLFSTGVEISRIPDVLPAATYEQGRETTANAAPARRFSKRGVRLGVHMAILDMGAHVAPEELKNKWVQRARSNHQVRRASLYSATTLSKISEADSMPSSFQSLSKSIQDDENKMEDKGSESALYRRRSGKSIKSPDDHHRKFRKALKRLSFSNMVSGRSPLTSAGLDVEFENGV